MYRATSNTQRHVQPAIIETAGRLAGPPEKKKKNASHGDVMQQQLVMLCSSSLVPEVYKKKVVALAEVGRWWFAAVFSGRNGGRLYGMQACRGGAMCVLIGGNGSLSACFLKRCIGRIAESPSGLQAGASRMLGHCLEACWAESAHANLQVGARLDGHGVEGLHAGRVGGIGGATLTSLCKAEGACACQRCCHRAPKRTPRSAYPPWPTAAACRCTG